jgi:hypothetical protein
MMGIKKGRTAVMRSGHLIETTPTVPGRLRPYCVEYLNSGIAFNSSLVALYTA